MDHPNLDTEDHPSLDTEDRPSLDTADHLNLDMEGHPNLDMVQWHHRRLEVKKIFFSYFVCFCNSI